MKHAACIAGAMAIVALYTAPASAAANRTFVSGAVGVDTGNTTCGRAVVPGQTVGPCRSFSQALSVTNTGGEIVVLDSAGYGPFAITQAVTISANNVEAAITATGGANGIDINAPGAAVTLNGLIVTSDGSGINGINLQSGAVLNIQNCVVRGFSNDGIGLFAAANITVSDTILSNNGQRGVEFAPSGAASAAFERVQFIGNQNGFVMQTFSAGGNTVAASMEDSVASGNTNIGLQATGNSTLMLSNSQVFNNKFGIDVQGTATVNFAQVTIFGNTTDGYIIESGTIDSFRTNVAGTNYNGNYIVDTNNSGSLTAVAPQ